MVNLKEIYENKAALALRIKEIGQKHTQDKGWESDEYRDNWAVLNKDYDGLNETIGVLERQEEIEKNSIATQAIEERAVHHESRRSYSGSRTVTEEHRAIAFNSWAKVQKDGSDENLSVEQREAVELTGIQVNKRDLDINLSGNAQVANWQRELRSGALNLTATTGGEYVPEGFVPQLEVSLLAFGTMRREASIIRTATGNDLPWPTTNDTANSGVLVAEEADVDPGSKAIATASVIFNAFKYSSEFILVSGELIDDSFFNIGTVVGGQAGIRIARITEAHFATGTGSGQPNGLTVATAAGVTTAATTAVTTDELIDMVHSIDPAYRANAIWMMHDNIVAVIRKLKDTTNQYLWQPGLQAGVPDRILGHRLAINQSYGSTITAADIILTFGDHTKYKIRDVASIRVRRLTELFAANDQEAYLVLSRHDGDLLDAGTDPVKHMITAAI